MSVDANNAAEVANNAAEKAMRAAERAKEAASLANDTIAQNTGLDINGLVVSAKDFLIDQGPQWAMNIIAAIVIYIVGKMIVNFLTRTAKKLMMKGSMDETLANFLSNIIKGIGIAFVLIAAISKLGVETTSLAAIIAAAGLAIGLSLQGSLSNLAAGVMLITFRPFTKGDFIEAAGASGSVQEVGIFTTTLTTPDNKKVIVPNGGLIGDNITNYSAMPTRRIDMVIGCGYDDDLKQVKEVLQRMVDEDDRILKDPECKIAVSELADSSINFVCRPWVNSADYWAVKFDFTENVKIEFDKAGISIPYPQRDVHMHDATAQNNVKAA